MATCTICGDELHPERAEKYDYLHQALVPRARGQGRSRIASVGVNKAADQFVVLDERTEREMAKGRFKKEPEACGHRPGAVREPPTAHASASVTRAGPHLLRPAVASALEPRRRSGSRSPTEPWGMTPEQIANKLGVSPYLVTQILARRPRPAGRR